MRRWANRNHNHNQNETMTEPDLFANIPEIKSPRLLWMEKHGITMEHRCSSVKESWTAIKGNTTFRAWTSGDDAIYGLCKLLKIRMWNEEDLNP